MIQNIRFRTSDELSLEGKISIPEGADWHRAVILCHPHPLMGGSMAVPIMAYLFRAFSQAHFLTFAFNFRGVGQSEGTFSKGAGEMLDLDAAIAYITGRAESETSLDAISLIGYSFGSWVLTHQAIENEWVDNYVLIAPPLTFYDFAHLTAGNGGLTKPKLIIAGDSDTVCPIAELEAFHSRLADPKTLHVLAKTNHFLLRAEEKIVTFCQNFIER